MRKTTRGRDIIVEQRARDGRIGRTLRSALAAGGLAVGASMLAPSVAAAQTPVPFGDVGLYFGWTWGAGGGFTWGIEGRGGVDFPDDPFCPTQTPPMGSAAGVLRFSFVELRPQLHLGVQGGVAFASQLDAMLDLGVGYRFDEDGGWSLPIGLELHAGFASTYFRADPLLEEVSTGGGAFFSSRLLQGCVVAGRALHDEAGHAPLPTIMRLSELRAPAHVGRDRAEALAETYEARAQAEWASVPAFIQLGAQLSAAGAPRSLRARALQAADDELRHAIGTARAAMRFGGASLALAPVTPATRTQATGSRALVRLAVESWVDGCLGEGRAAAVAAREAAIATDRDLSALHHTIAQEESRHAELAWDVLAWALAEGGDEVRHAVESVREAPVLLASTDTDADLASFGVLDARGQRSIAEAEHARALTRLTALIG